MTCEWHDKIFSIGQNGFQELALEIFRFQYENNPVYNSYVNALGIKPASVNQIEQIPFLPISFFKTDEIKTGKFNTEVVFESSGTTQTINSRHHVKDVSIYVENFTRTFESMYGNVKDWCILGLLPSYLEKGNSSLVYMVDSLIRQCGHSQSGTYLNDHKKLNDELISLENSGQKTLLIGVTYALLDFAEQFPIHLRYTTIMETGGMKGRRKELTRMEVHEQLKKAFDKNGIHSEYGMTELLSQAYSKKEGRFQCPSWMKVMIRDEEDPLLVQHHELRVPSNEQKPITGAINIIDLANVYSCSFIASDDVGRLYPDGSFEVLGRMDGSDLRGCSLLTV
jgi:phenylacetate-coenzyme A ligase PaaK-like adenylate-forming protein